MNFFEALILGALQGVTEFLPISSSGHLVVVEKFLGLQVENLKSFDVMVHMGTLLAILVYFWNDVKEMILALVRFCVGKSRLADPYAKLILFLIIGTIPAVILGMFGDSLDSYFRNVKSVGILMLAVAFVFLFAEFIYKKTAQKKSEVAKWHQAVIIGLAQATALIPGISRSGATISAGLFQGIERSSAARFSFLLGIPAIAGAGLLTGLKISENGGIDIAVPVLLIGFLSSFLFGLLSVYFLMNFLKKHTLTVFAIYRIALAVFIFSYFL